MCSSMAPLVDPRRPVEMNSMISDAESAARAMGLVTPCWAPGNQGATVGRISGFQEDHCIRLCEEVLRVRAKRHHTFPFLRGDPTPTRPAGVPLPVDAYFPSLNLVIEYMGHQHFENNPLMDRRAGRREQRLRYQRRRDEVLAQHGIILVRFRYDERLTRDTVRARLIEVGCKVTP